MSTDENDDTKARGTAATSPVDLGVLPTTPVSVTDPPNRQSLAELSVVVGGTLGRYEVIALLGAGGMGVVYRGRDPSLGRDLAIKVVRPRIATAEAQTRLLREAQAMAKLRHPNVVPVFDVGTVGDSVFVVMPYLDGGTLGEWLRASPRPWRDVLARFHGAGRGLAVAHAAGMIHRDFKPDNVLLDTNGDAQVADFGIARLFFEESLRPTAVSIGSELTQTGDVVGTPAYMPPEQLRGEPVDARADVFSFCVALYEGLYGERPFDIGEAQGPGALVALIDAIETGQVRAAAATREVPHWLRAAVLRGLRGRASERWPSISALLDHVHARRSRPRRVAFAISGLLVIASVTTAVAIATRGGPAVTPPVAPPTSYATRSATTSGDVETGALSPDGRQVAVVTEGELLLVDLDSAGARRVLATDLVSDGSTAWSPDGKRVAVAVRRQDEKQQLVIDVATGTPAYTLPYRGYVTFTGPDEIATWTGSDRSFSLQSLNDPSSLRTCNVPGTFHFLRTVVSAGTEIFLAVTSGSGGIGGIDRVLRSDRACSTFEVIADHLELVEIGRAQDGTNLIGLGRSEGKPGEILEIDREGQISRRPAPPFDREAGQLLGVRRDGSIVMIDGKTTWQLLRVSPDKATVVTGGSTQARIVMSPDGARFAMIESDRALRIVDLADPMARKAPIKESVHAVAWSPDGRELAILQRRGTALALITQTADGGSATEHIVDNVSYSFYPSIDWIDDDEIAFRRAGNRTFTALDRKTGATRDLFDATKGFTFGVRRSPRDKSLALYWNRKDSGPGIYIVVPGQPEKLLVLGKRMPAWSFDGTALFAYWARSPEIDRFDLATGLSTSFAKVPLERGATIVELRALPSGELIVQRGLTTSDVIIATPVR